MADELLTYWPILILLLLIFFSLGWLIAHLIAKHKLAIITERSRNLENQLAQEKQQLANEKHTRHNTEQERNQLVSELAGLKKEVNHLQLQLNHQKDNEERLQQQFENLAGKIIDEKGKRFSQQNEEQLKLILDPLKERIQHFEKKVIENNHQQIKQHSSLKTQLEQLKELNATISEEANNLTKALKGETKTQGNWGELILETVLEKSGLKKDREYFLQEHFTTNEGRRLQPDVVLHLPDNKRMIIDSKVSLTAYERYVNSSEESDRNTHLAQHIRSVKKHIQQLSDKEYEKLYETDSPDFVLLFIPVETAFSVVIEKESGIYQNAFEKNIVIVTPSTLLATLKTIDSLWQNEKQRKHTIEIATEAGKMYDKFVGFVNEMNTIGKRIRQTRESYDEAIKKLSDGRGNLVTRAEKLKEMGAKANKEINKKWLED